MPVQNNSTAGASEEVKEKLKIIGEFRGVEKSTGNPRYCKSTRGLRDDTCTVSREA